MPGPLTIPQDKLLAYVQATLLSGVKKHEAYRNYIDPNITDVYAAVRRLEARDDYHELMQHIVDTDDRAAKKSMMRVKSKYMAMTEKALDTAAKLLDEANEKGGSKSDKAQAVRLANETFGAMGVIAVADPGGNARQPGSIDKRSHIL